MITIVIMTFLVIINISLILWVVSFVNRLEAESSEIDRLSRMAETMRCGLNETRSDFTYLKNSVSDYNLSSVKRDKFISEGVDALANHLKLEIKPFHIKEEKKGFKIVKLKK